jgi:hypothetical protein
MDESTRSTMCSGEAGQCAIWLDVGAIILQQLQRTSKH